MLKSKMMYLSLFAFGLTIAVQATPARAEAISQAKAAELTLHRVERLVILKKIEDAFLNQIQSVSVAPLAHQSPDQPSFRAVVSQWPGTDSTHKQLEIVLNEDGKPISYTVLPVGSAPANSPTWSDKDPTTLSENSLHYVLEGAISDAKLVPYNQKLARFSISQATAGDGVVVAAVEMEASGESQKLRVLINLDGTFKSAEFKN